MRTRKYKTLSGLVRQAQQLNFNELKSRRFVHKKGMYVNFELPDEELDKAYKLLAGAVYSHVGSKWERLKYYRGGSKTILGRLIIEKDGTATYNAFQEYNEEIRTIQRIFVKG